MSKNIKVESPFGGFIEIDADKMRERYERADKIWNAIKEEVSRVINHNQFNYSELEALSASDGAIVCTKELVNVYATFGHISPDEESIIDVISHHLFSAAVHEEVDFDKLNVIEISFITSVK